MTDTESMERELWYLRTENERLQSENESLKRESHAGRHQQRLVVVESPYKGDVDLNVSYARAVMRDCLMHGEAPLASHLLYTQPGILNDENRIERSIGINAGLSWAEFEDARVVYTDLGISDGMVIGIDHARKRGHRVEYRTLPGWKKP